MSKPSEQPLTQSQFQALRAAVCQPHMNQTGITALGIDSEAYKKYRKLITGDDYVLFLMRCAAFFRHTTIELQRAATPFTTDVREDGYYDSVARGYPFDMRECRENLLQAVENAWNGGQQ